MAEASLPLPHPLDSATAFAGAFTAPEPIADALWLIASSEGRDNVAVPMHAQPLVKLRRGEEPVGLVAIHIGETTPLSPTAILSIDMALTVSRLIAADPDWADFVSGIPVTFAESIAAAAAEARDEALNPDIIKGATSHV